MKTTILRIRDVTAQKADIEAAGELLRAGGLVAFPTETVYGLGANGLEASACAGIYQVKGRPSDNPLILHAADRSMVEMAARVVTPLAEKLLAAFAPGPITLILPKRPEVPESVTGGFDTVGVRLPDNDVARALIRAAGVPVAAPSANLSGRPSPTTAAAVAADLSGRVPLILDGGSCRFGLESTIVDCTGDRAVILRPGAITRDMIAAAVGSADLDPALSTPNAPPRAPGMKYVHYAPKVPLSVIMGEKARLVAAFRREVEKRQAAGKAVGLVVSEEIAAALEDIVPPPLTAIYGAQGDLFAMAAHLYEALRYFDDKAVDVLLSEGVVPEGLGLAIMNRLQKASGGRCIEA